MYYATNTKWKVRNFLLLLLVPLLFFVVLRKGKSTAEAEKEVAW